MYTSSAIYEPMLPMGWIGQRPPDHGLALQVGTQVPGRWRTTVIDRSLSCGIKVAAEMRGLTIYDFTDWPQGISDPVPKRRFLTIWEIMEASKPALIWRLRVINSHQILLHAAAMAERNESPLVTRVRSFDLLSFDYPDEECSEGAWYDQYGVSLPSTITQMERHRVDVMPSTTFNLSLDWLEVVVDQNALIEFDMLNQSHAAVMTHDYALAVVTGWTICELRIWRLYSKLQGSTNKSSVATDALRQAGILPEKQADRLDSLRRHRNSWLHNGKEPTETAAFEAVRLACELLRFVIPGLAVRPPEHRMVL